jgi:coenzyme F420-reducing hydrogenase beta subunit/polysaccharide pyruvyl transferase WcaK-like protein
MLESLIPKQLCTRCGACFAADTDGMLSKDANGFPEVATTERARSSSVFSDVCSGEDWNYRALLTRQYGRDVPYDPASPDIGHFDGLFLLRSEDRATREHGQSGGVTTTLLSYAFDRELIDAAVVVRRGTVDGDGPFATEPYIARSSSELKDSMGSKYTICSTLEALKGLEPSDRFAATLLPCQTVGLKRLVYDWSPELHERCRLVIGPFCGLNLEEEAARSLARAAAIDPDQVVAFANRGGPFPGQTTFTMASGEERYVDRTAHRILYRMFAPLRCYTCTDYGNELADIVVADCWEQGKTGFTYPDGAAYVICRTERGKRFVEDAIADRCVESLPVDVDARLKAWEPSFYHRKVRAHNRIRYWARRGVPVPRLDYALPAPFEPSRWADRIEMGSWRLFRHPRIRDSVLKRWVALADAPKGSLPNLIFEDAKYFLFTHTYHQFTLRIAARRFRRYLAWAGEVMPRWVRAPLKRAIGLARRAWNAAKPVLRLGARLVGLRPALRYHDIAPREVVIIGGYGYGNTGDEAQLGANLERWRRVAPRTEALVLSPSPAYTARHHECRSAAASRTVLFRSDKTPDFGHSRPWFLLMFWPTLARMEINAQLMRAGLAPWFATSREAQLLSSLQRAAVLHVSGGGFMTGPTRSRLWDSCLVLRLCHRLGTPYFLTGQTLGIFENGADRWLARTALRQAVGISLRDPGESEDELRRLGVPQALMSSGVDDALFCRRADEAAVAAGLLASGLDQRQPYLAVNYHWWGQDEATQKASCRRLALVLDNISAQYGWHVLFIPMLPSDVEAQRSVVEQMTRPASILVYDYAYPLVRGVLAGAQALISFKHHPLIFAMGEGVPCLSVSFQAYYHRKNLGAMANLGQERFCVDQNEFYGAGFETLIGELLGDRDRISAALQERLSEARTGQDAFFATMLAKAGLTLGSNFRDRSN